MKEHTGFTHSELFFIHRHILTLIVFSLLIYTFLKQIDLITLSFFLNGCLSIIFFFNSFKSQKISMSMIHHFFIFLFFVYIPLNQYINNQFLYFNQNLHSMTLLFVNLLITCWLIGFFIAYKMSEQINYQIKIIKFKKENLNLLHILYIPATVIIVWTIASGHLNSLLFRGAGGGFDFTNQSIDLIYTRSFQPIFLISFFYFYILKNELDVKKTLLIFYFFIAMGYNFPLSDARFYAFIVILLFYTQFIMIKEKYSMIFFYYLFIGIFGSSFFELFRFLSRKISDYSFSFNYFYEGHFDSYENFLHTFNYVQDYSISYGYSLLSSIFFFIPREFWPSKSIGSGSFLAQNYIEVARNSNIANSCISEYFFNFHILGILIFSVIYGIVSSLLDTSTKDFIGGKTSSSVEERLHLVTYAVLLGLFLFHLRGDMMSSLAYTGGLLFAILLVQYSFGYKYVFQKTTSIKG